MFNIINEYFSVLSKKLRVWERQLMKDFHVGVIVKNGESFSDDEIPVPKEPEIKINLDKNRKFRSIAKKAALRSPAIRWKRTLNDVYKL